MKKVPKKSRSDNFGGVFIIYNKSSAKSPKTGRQFEWLYELARW